MSSRRHDAYQLSSTGSMGALILLCEEEELGSMADLGLAA